MKPPYNRVIFFFVTMLCVLIVAGNSFCNETTQSQEHILIFSGNVKGELDACG